MTVLGPKEGHQTELSTCIVVLSSCDTDPGSRATECMRQIWLRSSVLEANNLHPTPVT